MKHAIRLFALGLLWLIAAEASAQIDPKAQAILDRYKQVTGTDKPIPDTVSVLVEVEMTTDTVVSWVKLIKGSKPGCYRAEMNAAGRPVLIVADGQTGWMIIDTLPAQEIPQDEIKLLASVGDLGPKVPADDTLARCVYAGKSRGNHVLKGILKPTSMQIEAFTTMFFSVETGLMTSLETYTAKRSKEKVTITASEYKKFGTVTMPTRMEMFQQGRLFSVVEITKMEFNIPTEEWMFVKPDPVQ